MKAPIYIVTLVAYGNIQSWLAFLEACAKAKGVPMKTQTKSENKSTKATKTKIQNQRGKPFSIYFAGDLWSHKDLIGNAILADYIEKVSKGRYRVVLPQNLEQSTNRSVDIRNQDLKQVMTCDMAIFNFDGSELDSGTVVEFMYAKMLDVPCVILRTDFRSSGEGGQDQDPWNLMATHWPRTKVIKLNGMAEYQGSRVPGTLARTIEKLYRKMSAQIIESLDEVRKDKPLISNAAQLATLFHWAVESPGAGYGELFSQGEVQQVLAAKMAKGLLAAS
jgi:nucleoside 2-deoxyribosyltransferase